jgi:hypothetical protein
MGIALAVTVAVSYALCTLVWLAAPGPFLGFMNSLFHGMDFTSLVTVAPFSWIGFSGAARHVRLGVPCRHVLRVAAHAPRGMTEPLRRSQHDPFRLAERPRLRRQGRPRQGDARWPAGRPLHAANGPRMVR